MKNRVIFISLVTVMMFAACSSYKNRSETRSSANIYADLDNGVVDQKKMESKDGRASSNRSGAENKKGQISQENQTVSRLMIYQGSLAIQVLDMEAGIKGVAQIAATFQGFVEESKSTEENSRATIKLRIPSEKFYPTMDKLRELGQVFSHDISAADVTREFYDSDSRLKTSIKIRNRLYELLKNAKKVEERVVILSEIERLTKEINMLEVKIASMKSRIQLSTIIVSLQTGSLIRAIDRERSPFGWISSLNPSYRSIYYEKPTLYYLNPFYLFSDYHVTIERPAGFFEKTKSFYNNESDFLYFSPENAQIRIGKIKNYPQANSDFWHQAIAREFVNRGYQIIEEKSFQSNQGKFILVLIDDGNNKYYYGVGVKSKEDYNYIFEIYFPSVKAFHDLKTDLNKTMESIQINE